MDITLNEYKSFLYDEKERIGAQLAEMKGTREEKSSRFKELTDKKVKNADMIESLENFVRKKSFHGNFY